MNKEKLAMPTKDIPVFFDKEQKSACIHQFFKIAEEVRKEGSPVEYPVRWGIKVMCALCSQRRILWTDGEVEVLK